MQNWGNKIFQSLSSTDFEKLCLEAFHFQYENVRVYRTYCDLLKINTSKVKRVKDIPFLPIEMFKTHTVFFDKGKAESVFTSSGTSGEKVSRHFVHSLSLYEKSFRLAFEMVYGDLRNYCFLALLPSYLEREGSSLVYMCRDLINQSIHSQSGFYLNEYEDLRLKIKDLIKKKTPTILLGVTYALLDLSDLEITLPDNFILMETGGMKGKRKEMVREELHSVLKKHFSVTTVHSEYGMTELLSQAYSVGDGIFTCPPWMRVLIRDPNDSFTFFEPGKSGGINVIDLANIYSCCFLETKDLGKLHADFRFEILGRFDNSDIRGCNLMVQF